MSRLSVLKRRKRRNTRKARTVRSVEKDWSCGRPRERQATSTTAAERAQRAVGDAARGLHAERRTHTVGSRAAEAVLQKHGSC